MPLPHQDNAHDKRDDKAAIKDPARTQEIQREDSPPVAARFVPFRNDHQRLRAYERVRKDVQSEVVDAVLRQPVARRKLSSQPQRKYEAYGEQDPVCCYGNIEAGYFKKLW